MHRSWKCPRLDSFRRSKADEQMVQMSRIAEQQLGANHPEWTRALVPMMSLDREGDLRNHQRSKTETFEWIMRPEGGRIIGGGDLHRRLDAGRPWTFLGSVWVGLRRHRWKWYRHGDSLRSSATMD